MTRIDDEIKEFKVAQANLQQNYKARSQLIGQQQENALVKTEFDHLEKDAIVYKLVGPVLVRQDVEDAKKNVDKRIEYITGEIKRVDGVVDSLEQEMETRRNTVGKLQQEAQKTEE